MGSALSACTSRNNTGASGFPEITQRVFDRQPNWIVPPTRCHQRDNHHPARYRTPTPYPKQDRKRLQDGPDKSLTTHYNTGKAMVMERPAVRRIQDAARLPRKPTLRSPPTPHSPHPQSPITITWDVAPRRNRFERFG
ncbi:d7d68b24-58d7-417d-b453-a070ceaddc99 [Thermothielavioides terrestris]|uniref:Uncharacterized protein n=2 Tax=Thermothielavioides terrestris TaxID=2587410 RepID=G2R8P0_THETT|nr:uncharacterized protein THITE_2170715 [Thermothielavioides terrestris NRRL 8126]AEO68256.1 hypothetical protein THITE_2170715 [Thermothielavioides terrestris NRRL 8126]SPQ24488.1 d7d68b24-58d7-417d-b453-a070ceaddc99 [Thermothielavioides terrestris]